MVDRLKLAGTDVTEPRRPADNWFLSVEPMLAVIKLEKDEMTTALPLASNTTFGPPSAPVAADPGHVPT